MPRGDTEQVESRGWSEAHREWDQWDGEALEDGYEGSGQVGTSMWEAGLAALLEAESAGRTADLGQVGQTGPTGLAGQGLAMVDVGREEDGPSPS